MIFGLRTHIRNTSKKSMGVSSHLQEIANALRQSSTMDTQNWCVIRCGNCIEDKSNLNDLITEAYEWTCIYANCNIGIIAA